MKTGEKQKEWADPWSDLTVIDQRAVRFSQGTTALLALLGILVSPWAWALMALQIILGLFLGRRWCLPCLLYYTFIQPLFGQGSLEDARAPRFANLIGFALLSLAFLLATAGFLLVAKILAGVVFLLALLAASSGFCLGCYCYRLMAHFRGVRRWQGESLDLQDFNGPGEVLFWHPLCSDCQVWKERLPDSQTVDISKRRDLAEKYGILLVPTVYQIDEKGQVIKQLAP